MQMNLRSLTIMCFWFGVGLTGAVLVLKPNWVESIASALDHGPTKVVYQNRLEVPGRIMSTQMIMPLRP